MAKKTYLQAITQALAQEMARDERVCLLAGEGAPGGPGREPYRSLARRFGPDRVRYLGGMAALVDVAAGVAAAGLRPVAALSGADFFGRAMDRLAGRTATEGTLWARCPGPPLTVLLSLGCGPAWDAGLVRCLETWLLNLPGVAIAVPASPADAKGLLLGAMRGPGPALVLQHEGLSDRLGEVPEADEALPLGRAVVRRPGQDISLVAVSRLVDIALVAAERLDREGISVEVVDLRCLAPLDMETVLASVKKTHALVLPHEAGGLAGAGAEIAARVAEGALDFLDTPIVRLGLFPEPESERASAPEALVTAIRAIH